MLKIMLTSVITVTLPGIALAVDFRSPSGNIHCVLDGNAAVCEISELKPSYRRPASCEFDYGQTFAVGEVGAGQVLCVSDSIKVPGSDVLRYGEFVTGVGISCQSREDGMLCTNSDGGGFHISRIRQRVF